MSDDDKGNIRAIFEFALSHITDLATLWYVVKGNKPPEEAPEWTKAADNSPGGKGKPEDEAAYARFVSLIGSSRDRGELQGYLRAWVNDAYQLNHPERHVRERGRTLLEEWRVIIKQMAIDTDDQTAIDYLTALAKNIRRTYRSEVRAKGKTISTIKGRQKQACWESTCHKINEQMLSDGIHVPGEAEAPYTVQLKRFFKDQVVPFWHTSTANRQKLIRFARIKGKRHVRQGLSTVHGYASDADATMADIARKRQEYDEQLPKWRKFLRKKLL